MKPTDRLKEYADQIHDYPELKDMAKQIRKDAYDIDKAIQGAFMLIFSLAILLIMFVAGFFILQSNFDNHLEKDLITLEKRQQ